MKKIKPETIRDFLTFMNNSHANFKDGIPRFVKYVNGYVEYINLDELIIEFIKRD